MSSYHGFTDDELRDTLKLQQDKLQRLQVSPTDEGYEETRANRIVTVSRIIAEINTELESRKVAL